MLKFVDGESSIIRLEDIDLQTELYPQILNGEFKNESGALECYTCNSIDASDQCFKTPTLNTSRRVCEDNEKYCLVSTQEYFDIR